MKSTRKLGTVSRSHESERRVLVVVESPTKARYVSKILNEKKEKKFSLSSVVPDVRYDVVATCGHVIDLPTNEMGVYSDGERYYLSFTYRSKKQRELVEKLKKRLKEGRYELVYLATDPDREGEAISYHLYREFASVFPENKIFRARFYAITESEVWNAILRKEKIDLNLVKAQFARRAVDRIIGYVLSPYYSKVLKRTVSVGRVQTLALYFVTERFRQVRDFVPELFYYFYGSFYPIYLVGASSVFTAKTDILPVSEKGLIRSVAEVLQHSKGYAVVNKSVRKEVIQPPKPFTTASLQKAAFRKYGFSPEKTMRLAQSLYEKGHCTYVRTDSVDVSPEGYLLAREFIEKHFGEHYLNDRPIFLNENFEEERRKKHAHECIRPLHFGVPTNLNEDEQRLFYLIKSNFLASHMKPAVISKVSLEILPSYFDPLYKSKVEKIMKDEDVRKALTFKAEGSNVVFDGFLKVLKDEFRPENEHLFSFNEGQALNGLISLKKGKTQPPNLMSPEELVDVLEKKGVGRPSTYASVFKTLKERNYVTGKSKLVPTVLSEKLIAQVERKESEKSKEGKGILIDVDFTAKMETELDEVASGKLAPDTVIKNLVDQIKEVYPLKYVVPKIPEEASEKVKNQERLAEGMNLGGIPLKKLKKKKRKKLFTVALS